MSRAVPASEDLEAEGISRIYQRLVTAHGGPANAMQRKVERLLASPEPPSPRVGKGEGDDDFGCDMNCPPDDRVTV